MKIYINEELCSGCGSCINMCRFKAIKIENEKATIQPHCRNCGACIAGCPTGAIDIKH